MFQPPRRAIAEKAKLPGRSENEQCVEEKQCDYFYSFSVVCLYLGAWRNQFFLRKCVPVHEEFERIRETSIIQAIKEMKGLIACTFSGTAVGGSGSFFEEKCIL